MRTDYSFVSERGLVCMIYCLKCARQNHLPAVQSGRRYWCGHDPNLETDDQLLNPTKLLKERN